MMLPVDNGMRGTRGFDRYDMSNFDFPIDDNGGNDRDIETPPSGNIPSFVTEYRGYFYEVANINVLDSNLPPNFTYVIYADTADDGQYFDTSQVISTQSGFNSRSEAVSAARAWIDGIVGGSIDEGDTGDLDEDIGIGGVDISPIDLDFPEPPTQQEIRDSIQDSDSGAADSDRMGQFAVVGVVMIGFLGYLFYEAFKKGE